MIEEDFLQMNEPSAVQFYYSVVTMLQSDTAVSGEPLYAYQDPGRLLLLRLRTSRVATEPRQELRQNGTPDDRRHKVSFRCADIQELCASGDCSVAPRIYIVWM